ncbi:hypothetical protein A9Q92_05735 [Methylophaga sp. 42_8_T64]|nr:hypothetical protein A9Q92_05735 [Methylophaga sp. 42_8_T64]
MTIVKDVYSYLSQLLQPLTQGCRNVVYRKFAFTAQVMLFNTLIINQQQRHFIASPIELTNLQRILRTVSPASEKTQGQPNIFDQITTQVNLCSKQFIFQYKICTHTVRTLITKTL